MLYSSLIGTPYYRKDIEALEEGSQVSNIPLDILKSIQYP